MPHSTLNRCRGRTGAELGDRLLHVQDVLTKRRGLLLEFERGGACSGLAALHLRRARWLGLELRERAYGFEAWAAIVWPFGRLAQRRRPLMRASESLDAVLASRASNFDALTSFNAAAR